MNDQPEYTPESPENPGSTPILSGRQTAANVALQAELEALRAQFREKVEKIGAELGAKRPHRVQINPDRVPTATKTRDYQVTGKEPINGWAAVNFLRGKPRVRQVHQLTRVADPTDRRTLTTFESAWRVYAAGECDSLAYARDGAWRHWDGTPLGDVAGGGENG